MHCNICIVIYALSFLISSIVSLTVIINDKIIMQKTYKPDKSFDMRVNVGLLFFAAACCALLKCLVFINTPFINITF